MSNFSSSYLQFASPGMKQSFTGMNSPTTQRSGLDDTATEEHRRQVERKNLFFNMLKYRTKKAGGI
jgi:hypothetical protein